MNQKIPILPLNKYDRIWLQEVYDRSLLGDERVATKSIWGKLHHKLPNYYRPESIDGRLARISGEEIRLMGVMALQRNRSIIRKVDQVIYEIRKIILADVNVVDIYFDEITKKTGFTIAETSFLFRLASSYKQFNAGSTYEGNSVRFKSINLRDEMHIFYNYKEYPGIEKLILASKHERLNKNDQPFNVDEIISLNEKLDKLQQELEVLKNGQEIIWTDVMEELEELQTMYNLSKKNWRQMLFGKLTEMTISGIVSETLSKEILKYIIPEIKNLLNN